MEPSKIPFMYPSVNSVQGKKASTQEGKKKENTSRYLSIYIPKYHFDLS